MKVVGIFGCWVAFLMILAGVGHCSRYRGRMSGPQAAVKRVVKPLESQKTVKLSDFGRGRGIAFKAQSVSQGARSAVLNTVTVDCGESNMVVFVSPDLFGKGILVHANDLRLGPNAVPPCLPVANATGFVITAGLQDCESSLAMMTNAMIYTNQLVYAPSPLPSGIIRTNGAVIPIECTYARQRNVSSNAFQPTWVPFTSTIAAGSNLEFSLQLMSADWSSSVPPTVYYLDDMVNIQASVISMEQTPVRLFVDSCVATLSPDASSTPRYMVIDFSGCLVDAFYSGSTSSFVSPRIQSNMLQFSVQAFRFYQDSRSLIYLSCHLKVTPVSENPNAVNKACSYDSTNGWTPVEGDPSICSCCQTQNCPSAKARLVKRAIESIEADASVGPLLIEPVNHKPMSKKSSPLQRIVDETKKSGFSESPLAFFLVGSLASVAVVCLIVALIVLYVKCKVTSK
ncbi:zona pellucida sperm-binding protein 3-like [Erpetoichthys calabaricus]|uniref:Zona pellucida sperm-binding protein 3 n=1 Tax=Erpetoichthys calabaricus TaxID=27687 RepID=A0A8C4X5G9_ERPCA|nr:zona pellucida sperm-binding protein 3-like [Erpetoichthys calabaricus]